MNASKLKVNKEVPYFPGHSRNIALGTREKEDVQNTVRPAKWIHGQTEESEQMTHYSSRLARQALPVFVWRLMYIKTVCASTCS